MRFDAFQVRYLGSGEAGSDECLFPSSVHHYRYSREQITYPRMLPMRAVRGEDTIAKEPAHSTHSRSKTEVVELCGQNCFDVLRLTRHDHRLPHEAERLRVPTRRQVMLAQTLEYFPLKSILLEETKPIDPEHGVELAPLRSWFASRLAFEPLLLNMGDDPSPNPNHDDERQNNQSKAICIHHVLLWMWKSLLEGLCRLTTRLAV